MRMIFLSGAALLSITAQANAATVVTADRMLDVATGRYVEHPAIFIDDGGHITSVGDARTVRWSADVKHIDLPGETLLPGLIDMHVHLTSLAEVGGYTALRYTDSFWPAVGMANARKTIDAGFTTVRNVGAANFDDVGLKQAIDGGWGVGPRIIPSGYAIGATGGHCDDNAGLPPSMEKQSAAIVDSPEAGRQRVRFMHKYGAQSIKICAASHSTNSALRHRSTLKKDRSYQSHSSKLQWTFRQRWTGFHYRANACFCKFGRPMTPPQGAQFTVELPPLSRSLCRQQGRAG